MIMFYSVYAVIYLFLFITIEQVRAYSGYTNISGNNVIGGTVTVTCSWILQANEDLFDLTIRPPNTADTSYYYIINSGTNLPLLGPLLNASKHSLDRSSFNNQRVSMSISGLKCSDDQDYGCFFRFVIGTNNRSASNSTSHLDVKVRPRTPVISVNHTGTNILENTNITATCRANWGRLNRGRLRFVVYRNGIAENIVDTDPRIIDKKMVPIYPGEEECSSRVEWKFQMQVSSADQNLMVACFVNNLDFPVDPVPTACNSPASQFCNKTETQRIVYGVSDNTMTLERSPGSELYQGMNVTLTCMARGLPQPTYMWVRNGDDNSTQLGVTNADGSSTLTLTNLKVNNGASYSCYATNTVIGISYTASKQITFIVSPTTTTTMTTTTTPTPTTKASTGTLPSAGTKPLNGGGGGDEHGNTFIGNLTITRDNVVGGTATIRCSWTLTRNDTLFDLTLRPANSPVYYFMTNMCGLSVHGNLYEANRHTIEYLSPDTQSVSMRISGLQRSDDHDYSCFFRVVSSHRFTFHDTISHLYVKGI